MFSRRLTSITIFSRRDDAKIKLRKPGKKQCKQAMKEQKEQWEKMIKESGIKDDEWIEISDWEPPTLEEELLYWKNEAEKLQHHFDYDEKLIKAENERDQLRLRVLHLEIKNKELQYQIDHKLF